jgi:hypothetical protein
MNPNDKGSWLREAVGEPLFQCAHNTPRDIQCRYFVIAGKFVVSERGLKLAVSMAHSIFEKRLNGLSELIDHRVIILLIAQRA